MKKRVYGKKLSRKKGSRRALLRSLVRALVAHGSIKTTKAKAKAVQAEIDKLVNLAKKGGQNERKRIYSRLGNDKETTQAIFTKVAPNFPERQSGFTRIIKLGARRGDRSEMVRLEFVNRLKGTEEKGKSKKSEKVKSKKKTKKK